MDIEPQFENPIPASVLAEQSVLGGLLFDPEAWDRIEGSLTEADFYRHDHRLIWHHIERLASAGRPMDIVTVHEALVTAGKSDEAGGLSYLAEIAHNTPSSANIAAYAKTLRSMRTRRDVLTVGHQITALASQRTGETEELLDEVTRLAMGIVETRDTGNEPRPIHSVLKTLVEQIDVRFHSDNPISGLPTGFADLDALTCGLQNGDLIIVAGRPSMGKTTLAMNIGENVSMNGGVAFVVSLEMSAEQLVERSVARLGAINTQTLRTGKLTPSDWNGLTHAIQHLQSVDLTIADDTALSRVSRIRLAARKLKQQRGRLDIIIVDYLQLMLGDGDNRNDELSSITRSLKHLAKELNCPIVVLSQLSRDVERRTDKRPIMSDLRDSGAIEQDADVIMFVYRDEVYHPDTPMKGFAEILLRKQRMGPQGEVTLVFQGKHSRFLDANPQDLAEARNASAPARKPRYSLKD